MKRLFCGLFLVCCVLPAHAQLEQLVAPLIKGAPKQLMHVSPSVTRQVFRSARANLKAPASLMSRVERSVVQVVLPSATGTEQARESVQASGFLLSAYGQVWVASAYHVMGGAGRERVIRMISQDGEEKEVTVEVAAHGTSGRYGPDLSLAPIRPEDIPEGMEPLELAEPDLNTPAYSVGYVSGPYSMDDTLPVRREFLQAQGAHLFGTYHIDGSSWKQPITGNGQCGSPIVQQVPGTDEWRVVGLHNGHHLDLDNPSLSRGSGVNLSVAVPYLLDSYFDDSVQIPTRSLYIRGFYVGRLQQNEWVSDMALIRDGQTLWTKDVRKLLNPYSDDHAELAFEGDDVKTGDQIVFTVIRKQDTKPRRSFHTLTFVMP